MNNLFDSLVQAIKKHSPEILVGVGVVGVVAGTVVACKDTKKLDPVLEEHEQQMTAIHMAADTGVTVDKETHESIPYDEKDKRRDTTITYIKTGYKIAKIYLPAGLIICGSIGCILGSHKILTSRNIGLSAAYAGISKTFEDYRENIIEKFGKDADVEARYNIKAKKKKGKNGEEDSVVYELKKSPEDTVNCSDHSRFFDSDSKCFDKSKTLNINTIFSAQKNLNLRLKQRRDHTVSLNEVYDVLDLRPAKDGRVLGYKWRPGIDPLDENGIPDVIKIVHWVFDDKTNENIKKTIKDEMNEGWDSEPVMLLDFPGLVQIV